MERPWRSLTQTAISLDESSTIAQRESVVFAGGSKAGQKGCLKTAAMALSNDNTTLNVVMPGSVSTGGRQDLGQDELDTMAASIPLTRLGAVKEI